MVEVINKIFVQKIGLEFFVVFYFIISYEDRWVFSQDFYVYKSIFKKDYLFFFLIKRERIFLLFFAIIMYKDVRFNDKCLMTRGYFVEKLLEKCDY